METRHINHKSNYLFGIIAGIGLLFSCIFIIRAFNERKIYDAFASNTPPSNQSILGQKIANIQDTLKANDAVQKQDYEKALKLISGNTSNDYYNRGTIQTLLAYQKALQNDLSGLEDAQIFIAQAEQNFDITQKLSTSPAIIRASRENQKTVSSLSAVVDTKTCYNIGNTIITNIHDISAIIKNIQDMLFQEEMYINKRKSSLDSVCYDKLYAIVNTSKQQAGLLQLQMQKDANSYISDFSDKIENPIICLQNPYENILPTIIKGKEGLAAYEQQHINTIEALKSNDSQSIKDLCDQSKNDAQINQQIQDSVQELLQKLEDNKLANQEKNRPTNEVKYKDFLNEDERRVLQEIQTTNQGWINTILDIRGRGNYNPERYINTMFNQFYGNSGDFIDLHK